MSTTSGHKFQYEIEERVIANGWQTFPEQSYVDDVELKPREIDFIALQQSEKTNLRGNQLALVVECKYLPSNVSLYIRSNPKEENAYFIDGYNKDQLFRDKSRFHFLYASHVATNIVRDVGKKDNIGAAIMQSIKALLYFRGTGRKLDTKGVFFPVVVYGGPGKMLDQNGAEIKSFLYYRSYEWKEPYSQNRIETRHMYVDVIHESDVKHYLDDIFKPEMSMVISYGRFIQAMARKKSSLPNQAR